MIIVCSNCSRIFNSDEQSPEGYTKCPFCAMVQKPKLIPVQSADFDDANINLTDIGYNHTGKPDTPIIKDYIEAQKEDINHDSSSDTETHIDLSTHNIAVKDASADLSMRKTGKLRDLTESGRNRKLNKSILELKEDTKKPIVGMSKLSKPKIMDDFTDWENEYISKRPVYRPFSLRKWSWHSKKRHSINYYMLIPGLLIFIISSVFLVMIDASQKNNKNQFLIFVDKAHNTAVKGNFYIAAEIENLKSISDTEKTKQIFEKIYLKINSSVATLAKQENSTKNHYTNYEVNKLLRLAYVSYAKHVQNKTNVWLAVIGMILGLVLVMFAFHFKKVTPNPKISSPNSKK